MEKRKKKTAKRIVFAALALLLVAGLTVLPFLLDRSAKLAENKGSVLSARVETGSIQKTLSGTGTLTEQEAVALSVLESVEVTEYLVSNGQYVREGDAVALVDRVSVMETISAVREAMDEITAELTDMEDGSYSFINAPAPGRIKAVYAKTGDSVQEVMREHGALAVLSLDGLMALKLPAAGLSAGQAVIVVLSDETELEGRVETVADGEATVTFSDLYGSVGERVQIRTPDGESLGSAELYVHSAWKAMASSGTVYTVFASQGESYWTDGTILSINEADGSLYESLLEEYRSGEELMIELFRLYQSGVVSAPCDGLVSGADESLLTLLSAQGGASIRLLANAPGGDPEASFRNRIGMIMSVNGDGTATVRMQSWDTEIEDYLDPGFLITSADSMTEELVVTLPPIYSWTGEGWMQSGSVQRGDIFVFAYGSDLVWMICVGHNDLPEPTPELTPVPAPSGTEVPNENGTTPTGGGMPSGSGIPSGNGQTSGNGQSTDNGQTSESGKPSGGGGSFSGGGMPSGGGGSFSGGGMPSGGGGMTVDGGMPSGGGGMTVDGQENSTARFPADGAPILSITPQETMKVSITIDELDILLVHKGQTVTVTLDALTGQSFTGSITEVDTTPSNSGGHSKYSAVVELQRTGKMLDGMNASARIVVEERDQVLLIPSEALSELNGKPVVYTGYDSRTEQLVNPVVVEIGLSDGLQVQILSGLNNGDEIWYEYYDTLEIEGLSDGFFPS